MAAIVQRILAAIFVLILCSGTPARADNPFGVMLWPVGESPTVLLARARGLGVAWYRPPAVFVDRWKDDQPCPACTLYADSGLKVVLTVRNGGTDTGTRAPSEPPTDLQRFAVRVASVLSAWRPAYLVVENEEDNPALYSDPDDRFSGYRAELNAACAVAHARGIRCTNGGLSFESAALLTWNRRLADAGTDSACAFARRAFSGDGGTANTLCAIRSPASATKMLEPRLGRLRALLALYRDASVDAVNFHWYGRDAQALDEVALYLRQATGKALISNEIGQRPGEASAQDVRPLLRAITTAGLTLAIWYSIDSGWSVSLFDPQGRLRATGWEFQRQMTGRK